MAIELAASLGIFKSLFDAAKGLKDINDAAIRNAAVIELQGKILAAQMQQATLIDRVSELETQVASFETWEGEKKQYRLTEMAPGAFAYIKERAMRGGEPAHYICANCYEHRKKSILQHTHHPGTFGHIVACSACGSKTRIEHDYIPPA